MKQAYKWVTVNGLAPAFHGCAVEDQSETTHGPAPDSEQIDFCRTWLRLFARPTKRTSRNRTSYGYKHDVERWSESVGPHRYIANGAFIQAALLEGYLAVRDGAGSPNAHFNFTVKLTPLGEPVPLAAGRFS